MSKNKIVYLRWGERYTQEHVAQLFDKVNQNCSVDFDFVTMDFVHNGPDFDELKKAQHWLFRGTQDPESSVTDNPNQRFMREDAGGMAHWRKYLMFNRDVEQFDKNDTLLYLDLDTLITGDLAYFFDLDMRKPYIARSWQFEIGNKWRMLYNLRSCPYFNSSVLVWKPGQCLPVYDEMMRQYWHTMYTYGSNDNWLFHRFGPHAYSDEHRNFFNWFPKYTVASDKRFLKKETIIHTLAGMSMSEKNELCL